MYLCRCDGDSEDQGLRDSMQTSHTKESSLKILRRRAFRRVLSGVGFTLEVVVDTARFVLFPVRLVGRGVVGCLSCAWSCCCGCLYWNPEVFQRVGKERHRIGELLKEFLGIRIENDNVAMTVVHPDLIDREFASVDMDGRLCRFQKTAFHSDGAALQLRNGASCIILQTRSKNDELRCIIFNHKYRPRGPVGSLLYFSDIRLVRHMNHPRHFLALAGGRLFVTHCRCQL